MLVIKLLFGKHQHFGRFFHGIRGIRWALWWGHIVDDWDRRMCEKYLSYFMQAAWQCPMNFSYFSKRTAWVLEVEFTRIWQFCQHLSTKMECDGMHWRWWSCGNCFSWNSGFLRTKSWTRWNWCLMCLGFSMIFPGFSDVFRWFCSGIIRLGSRESREILKMLQAAIDSWRTTLPVTGTLKGENWEKRTTSEKDREELLVTGGHRKDTCPPSNALQVCHICHDPIVIPSCLRHYRPCLSHPAAEGRWAQLEIPWPWNTREVPRTHRNLARNGNEHMESNSF